MEAKKDVYKDILENIGRIYNHEKTINEKIIEIQRTNANLLRNQRDLAKIVISIDKQQQRIINQMNFIANRLDKLDKDTDAMKEEQLKMNEKLLRNSAAEQQNATIFRNIQEEIDLGNRANADKMDKIRETVAEITKHIQMFNLSLEQVNSLTVTFLGDIRKELSVSKKASIIIKEGTPKLAKGLDSNGLNGPNGAVSKSIHIPKAASVNDQIKGVILKQIASKEKINQLKKIPSKQAIGLPKGNAIENPVKRKSSKENVKETAKDAVEKKEPGKKPDREDKVPKSLDQPKESTEKESNEKKSPSKDVRSEDEQKAASASSGSPTPAAPVKSADDAAVNQPTKEPKPVKEAAAAAAAANSPPQSKTESNELKSTNESRGESKPGLKGGAKEEKKNAKTNKEPASTNKQMAMLIVADNSDSSTKVVVASLHDSLQDVTKSWEARDTASSKSAISAGKEPSHLNIPAIPNEPLPKQVNLSNLVVGSVCELPPKEVKRDAKSDTKSDTKSSESTKEKPNSSKHS